MIVPMFDSYFKALMFYICEFMLFLINLNEVLFSSSIGV